MNLRKKFLSMIFIPVVLFFSVIITYSTIVQFQKSSNDAQILAEAVSKEYAYLVKGQLEVALNTAKTVSNISSEMVEQGITDRKALDLSLRKIIESNDSFYGIWVVFEPNSFDGKDAEYAGKKEYDAKGRFTSYWFRDGNQIVREYFEIDQVYDPKNNDYYTIPLNSGIETITEPYYEEVEDGKKVLMTSLAVPIKSGGKILGVAGIDMTLEYLQSFIKETKLYETGFGRIVSHEGIVVAHPDESRVGQPKNDLEKVLFYLKLRV
ncbi:Cache domain-containing protein [Alkalithermobacter thermoalcaliphilus JW-YL-7 = DSM 7308]|uniref:Cache domain-containing protein n=1 Tax=Alkalithermobacter thermoalcaliphilus JW-YL-7 = DSM 7308 TaxID=1121328 RepID=A0A150FNP3_CLOPD|nr:Cache domain containing protein [[Clostridium] paradoxum JW-YL-7 = DSM 7308]SHK86443.1 Cache domain-containing protein [[Clostridium] paradoxum JW-YL-7 = DSM 7308]